MGAKITQQTKESEAATLRRLIDAEKLARGITSDSDFAKLAAIPGGKSMVSQHTKALRPISLECAVAYAIGLMKPIDEISPRLAGVIAKLPKAARSPAVEEKPNTSYRHNVTSLPAPMRPMLAELAALAERINDRGLAQLIERAIVLAGQYPREKPNHAN